MKIAINEILTLTGYIWYFTLALGSGKVLSIPKCINTSIIQWWFVNLDTFVPGRFFRINEFSGLLNRPSVQKRKSVPALFVQISEISGLSEPGLTNHHCTLCLLLGVFGPEEEVNQRTRPSAIKKNYPVSTSDKIWWQTTTLVENYISTVKGFNFAGLKVHAFLDGTFRGGLNFTDYSIASYIYQQITIDRSVVKWSRWF